MSRIIGLKAENFKRLKVVSIDPDSNTVVIAGRNAQGKTSVLDAIHAALAGRHGSKELVQPIREGEKRATVVVELEDLTVERKWTPSGSTLTVTPRGGVTGLKSPQAVLDRLIGHLSFDPLEFATADPRTQVKTLIDLIGREQFDAISAARKEQYEARTEVNRDVRRLQGEIESRQGVAEVAPVDTAAEVALLRDVEEKVRLRAQWGEIQERINTLVAQQEQIAATAASLPDGDVEAIRQRIAQAGETNREAQRWIELQAALREFKECSAKAAAYGEEIAKLDAQRAQLIEQAQLPIEGLSFDEDGVMLNDIPFVQASAAERLKTSVAMAMALNPGLRVICIRDASLLDADSRAWLKALAEEKDFQIWYEVVGDSDSPFGVVIEDGEVQA